VALSVGRPDGIYYAGKRLTPWMSSTTSMEFRRLSSYFQRQTPELDARYQELQRYRAGESLVVRWTIEQGIPSVPKTFTAGAASLTEGVRDEKNDAFRWGKQQQHGHWLGHFFLKDLFELGHKWSFTDQRNSNDYIDAVTTQFVDGFADEWVLPQADLLRLVYEADLRTARARYQQAIRDARKYGVDVDAIRQLKKRAP
jgi:hypothetical protein